MKPDQAGGFHFIQVARPGSKEPGGALKKQARSHAARNSQARRQRVIEYQAAQRVQLGPPTASSNEDEDLTHGWTTSIVSAAVRQLFTPNPMTPLGAGNVDPFQCFARGMSPFDSYLLNHCESLGLITVCIGDLWQS